MSHFLEVPGQTNVLSSRLGAGSVEGLGKELGDFIVTTMELPWNLTKDRLGAVPRQVVFVESMELETVERQCADLPPCDAIVAIGGGQAIDLGKYFAWRRGCRLVTIPTILSVDAFVTPKAAVRRNHRVEYVGHASPDPLVIDYDLLRTAPPELNIAGVGDILSIHTATRDWELAEAAGQSEYPFSADDVLKARAIVDDAERWADAIWDNADEGLRAIVEGYLRINTICLPADHYRTEEGSEHFLFYELEERLQRGFIHGSIVGLGIYVMSRLQQNEPDRITELMNRVGLRYQPADMEIDRDTLIASLQNLRSFVRQRGLWQSIIDQREIDLPWIESALAGLRF
jgi:glycerol-1-phosphate dehydrogenase [NAD(P)+]